MTRPKIRAHLLIETLDRKLQRKFYFPINGYPNEEEQELIQRMLDLSKKRGADFLEITNLDPKCLPLEFVGSSLGFERFDDKMHYFESKYSSDKQLYDFYKKTGGDFYVGYLRQVLTEERCDCLDTCACPVLHVGTQVTSRVFDTEINREFLSLSSVRDKILKLSS